MRSYNSKQFDSPESSPLIKRLVRLRQEAEDQRCSAWTDAYLMSSVPTEALADIEISRVREAVRATLQIQEEAASVLLAVMDLYGADSKQAHDALVEFADVYRAVDVTQQAFTYARREWCAQFG